MSQTILPKSFLARAGGLEVDDHTLISVRSAVRAKSCGWEVIRQLPRGKVLDTKCIAVVSLHVQPGHKVQVREFRTEAASVTKKRADAESVALCGPVPVERSDLVGSVAGVLVPGVILDLKRHWEVSGDLCPHFTYVTVARIQIYALLPVSVDHAHMHVVVGGGLDQTEVDVVELHILHVLCFRVTVAVRIVHIRGDWNVSHAPGLGSVHKDVDER
mmetsp:Transcript_11070/g.23747  ORF Transcript_11070/g.23747 Transcript_11070/m.23747 type:complete len:216 (+) Transcript_11070:637-1284(+)